MECILLYDYRWDMNSLYGMNDPDFGRVLGLSKADRTCENEPVIHSVSSTQSHESACLANGFEMF